MSVIPAQVRIGVAASAALAVALVSGAAGFTGAWKWRSADVARAEAALADMRSALREAEQADSIRSAEATRRQEEMQRTLDAQVQLGRYREGAFIRRLDEVSDRSRLCLTGRTIRVLRSEAGGGRANEGADPKVGAAAAPGSSAAPGVGPAGRDGGLSESAASRYLGVCMSRYREAQVRYVSLVRRLEDLPCVEIIEDM
jgi:hypothetical protein